jgi:hypothetical protein
MMSNRNTRSFSPRVEALDERVALSVAAPAVHVLSTAHDMHTTHNGVLVNLTPDATGIQITRTAFDPQAGVIRIRGIATFPPVTFPFDEYPTTTSISATASQSVGRLQAVSGQQSTMPVNYDYTGFTLPFTLNIPASSGRFVRGIARVTISGSVPDLYYDYYPVPIPPSADVIVSLRQVRF